jgi:hypothetical protein
VALRIVAPLNNCGFEGRTVGRDTALSNAGSSKAPSRAQFEKLELTERSRRLASQGGNAILEAPLVLMPMLALFLGLIDISFAISIQSTLTSAAREGTRFAVTYGSSFNGNSCAASQAACVAQVVQLASPVGRPAAFSSYITMH